MRDSFAQTKNKEGKKKERRDILFYVTAFKYIYIYNSLLYTDKKYNSSSQKILA